MTLHTYTRKRDFAKTPEPEGAVEPSKGAGQFVIHMHDATRLHYDVRLELDGVLKCWAVPKGPSLDPAVRRLAVMTEDHPLQYLSFEGVIPKGEYGGGPMLVWDRGLWFPEGDALAAIAKGHLSFRLEGEKARGRWSLVHTGRGAKNTKQWMLIKSKDDTAQAEAVALVDARPESVRTGRKIDEVLADGVQATLRDVVRAGDPAAIPGAVKAKLPTVFAPQLATAVAAAPKGEGWIAEVKLDGYRLVVLKHGPKVRLMTRGGLDWSGRFPGLVKALSQLPVTDAVLDGEAVVLDRAGKSDFGALQQAIGHDDGSIALVLFDLVHVSGWDLSAAALLARKEALRLLVVQLRAAGVTAVHYSDHIVGDVEGMHREACAMGLEGTVVKKADAPYVNGRSKTWLKVKCFGRQELVIVGFTDPKGARGGLGALLLGVQDDGALRYAGKVGTGFGAQRLRELHAALKPLERRSAAVTNAPRGRDIHWVEPTLVAEIAFREWTKDGLVRQASFVGLREDKPATQVTRETPTKVRTKPREVTTIEGVRLTHPDKVMFPDLGITKQELAEYYAAVADRIVPYMHDRPLSLVRCPDGVRGSCFYQKHAHKGVPPTVRRITVDDDREPYLVVDSKESLLTLVHFGVVELHVWGARADKLDRPDLIVMDLDPAPDVSWSRVAKTALALKAQLEALGLVPFLRTTGGKGLHVVAPLVRKSSWDDVKALTQGLAVGLAKHDPKHYTAKLAKQARGGKIFIDYLRNTRHATAVASWSVRARDGAPVAQPLAWDSLDPKHRPETNLRLLVADLPADPWVGFEQARRPLTRAMLDAVASL